MSCNRIEMKIKLTSCLSCLLLFMAVCLWGIQGTQSQAIETEVSQMSTQASAAGDPKDVENTKQQLRRAIELDVLKRIKLGNNKMRKLPKVVRAPKLKSAPKPRKWISRLKTGGKYVAGIVAPVILHQGFTRLYDHFTLGHNPEAPPPAAPTNAEELQEQVPMHYAQLAPFMINPSYIQNPAMSYPVYQPNPGFPNPSYPNQGHQSPVYYQGYQNQGFPTPAFQNQNVHKPYLETPHYKAPSQVQPQPEIQPQPQDDSEEDSSEEN